MLSKARRAFHPGFVFGGAGGMIDAPRMSNSRSSKLPFFVHRLAGTFEEVLVRAGVRDEAVLLAVSGGSDSMALLELASLTAARLGINLHVCCVDHGQRPEVAAESELVRAASARAHAEFHAVAVRPDGSDENSLRRARHGALASIAHEAGCRFILLGHTADDQVETILFRFLRGAGFGGLAGMREVRGALLRPLLSLRRQELRRLLLERKIVWTDDATNESDRYARGRLRRGVLPAIETAFGAGVLEHLLDVAPHWRADEDFLEEQAGRLLAYASRRGAVGAELDLEALATGHRALISRVIRRWLVERTGRTTTAREIASIERWLDGRPGRGEESLDLPRSTLSRRGGRLAVKVATPKPNDESDVDIDCSSDDPSLSHGDPWPLTGPSDRKAVLPPSYGRVRFPRN